MNFRILKFDSLPSTNTTAMEHAKNGADEGLCIVAAEQTAGRGRHGRTWVSTPNAGLYFSIILRPKIEIRFLPLITLMTGVAVHETLRQFNVNADIKWVNDLLVDEQKICGILAESCDTPNGLAIIVGIGINLRSHKNQPATATSIENETGNATSTDEILELLTKNISCFYEILCSENGDVRIRNFWTERSSYSHGKSVKITTERTEFGGVTDGLEENGALRIISANSEIIKVSAGDVTRLRPIDEKI